MTASDFFQTQLNEHKLLNLRFHRLASRIASIRVAVFIIGLVAAIYFINQRELAYALICLFGFMVIFILLIKKHNTIKFKRDQHKYLVQINKEELQRLAGNFDGIEGGDEFAIKDHAYAEDLDILGDHSIYQVLNRTSTYPGKKLLAERLLQIKTVPSLAQYQNSVSELAQTPVFIQSYQALGKHVLASNDDFARFETWLAKSNKLVAVNQLSMWSYLLPGIFIVGLVLATTFSITYYSLLPIIIVHLILLSRYHKYAQEVVEHTEDSLKMLKSFVYHIELIEKQAYSSKHLVNLVNSFNRNNHEAKTEIKIITRLLEHLQARNNIFHVLINIPLLLDIHWLLRIENWQKTNRENIKTWFDSLAEFEVLNSLAGQAFAHSDWTFPLINAFPYLFSANDIGHPLIPKDKRVVNEFSMEGKGEVILLTGPNMAGKSTFLRTIGVNIILAQMGGAVCASNLEFNPDVELFTAMRIKDDLSESISSFYAELSRIKQLLKAVEQHKPVLFFLDEILKGTNSADRHKGAEALIKQLSELGVSGFVSTHDLELGALAKQLNQVQNYSFESIIDHGKINFDYKIRSGICQSFNACELMRQMGIKV